jgi:hypothetical protein
VAAEQILRAEPMPARDLPLEGQGRDDRILDEIEIVLEAEGRATPENI